MADDQNTATPMEAGDIVPPPPTDTLEPAAPLENGSDVDEDQAGSTNKVADAKAAIKDGASKIGAQAADKARLFAEDGKARAGGALDQLSQMLTEAAGNVDDKLGEQYGQYARTAATSVQQFSETLKGKDVDELVETGREFVRKSPAIAIGVAAAAGFVLARLLQSGLDERA